MKITKNYVRAIGKLHFRRTIVQINKAIGAIYLSNFPLPVLQFQESKDPDLKKNSNFLSQPECLDDNIQTLNI